MPVPPLDKNGISSIADHKNNGSLLTIRTIEMRRVGGIEMNIEYVNSWETVIRNTVHTFNSH